MRIVNHPRGGQAFGTPGHLLSGWQCRPEHGAARMSWASLQPAAERGGGRLASRPRGCQRGRAEGPGSTNCIGRISPPIGGVHLMMEGWAMAESKVDELKEGEGQEG
jgi:hypothetical protein